MDEQLSVHDVPCRIRPGELCRLCSPGASGPWDCPLVYLVMTDPDLREGLLRLRADAAGQLSVR